LYFQLRKKKLDTALIFHTSQRPILPLCALLGIHRIIGTRGINKGLDDLLTNPLEARSEHEIQRRLEIVHQTGAKELHPLLEFYLSSQDFENAEVFLKQNQIPSYIPIVGLHPGAKDKFKQWPPENFIRLGNLLKDHLGCQIIVTGNASEKTLVEKVAGQIKGAIAVTGDLALRTVAALIRRMSLMIANDTGPMHVAFAMQTPTLALFAPTDPKFCGPYMASRVKVIQKSRTCTPCLRKKCLEPLCMMQIGIQEAYEKALELFYTERGSKIGICAAPKPIFESRSVYQQRANL
jgi:ADP-heptose:LPS heptosyltransferase